MKEIMAKLASLIANAFTGFINRLSVTIGETGYIPYSGLMGEPMWLPPYNTIPLPKVVQEMDEEYRDLYNPCGEAEQFGISSPVLTPYFGTSLSRPALVEGELTEDLWYSGWGNKEGDYDECGGDNCDV